MVVQYTSVSLHEPEPSADSPNPSSATSDLNDTPLQRRSGTTPTNTAGSASFERRRRHNDIDDDDDDTCAYLSKACRIVIVAFVIATITIAYIIFSGSSSAVHNKAIHMIAPESLCDAGTYNATRWALPTIIGTPHGACIICPMNSYCDGEHAPITCPANSLSPAGSTSLHACQCRTGWITITTPSINGDGTSTVSCNACPSGSYCPGESLILPCGHSDGIVGWISPAGSTSHHNCTCDSSLGYVNQFDGHRVICVIPDEYAVPEVARASDRLVMVPILVGGLNNQVICLQEAVKIARAFNATLCWPLVKLDGLQPDRDTMRPFDALFDRQYFAHRVFTKYNIHMASHVDDVRLCDITFEVYYNGAAKSDACKKYGINDTSACDVTGRSMQDYPEIPYAHDSYLAHYAKGGRMVFLKQIFQQWITRVQSATAAPTISMINDNVIRPSLSLQPAIDRVMHYFDQIMISSKISYTIGIHLRVESDLWVPGLSSWCGKSPEIIARVCDQLHADCKSAICLIATGAPRNQWITSLTNKCRVIITKEDAWTTSGDIIPTWSREEAAMIDMWTVTRTHLFVGCSMSTMSMAAIDLQPIRFNQWIDGDDDDDTNPSSIATGSMARTILSNDIGGIMYGQSWTSDCFPQTIKWIAQHQPSAGNVACKSG